MSVMDWFDLLYNECVMLNSLNVLWYCFLSISGLVRFGTMFQVVVFSEMSGAISLWRGRM